MIGIKVDQDFNLIIDVVRNTTGRITSGFVLDNIDYQRCHMITIAQKGEIKGAPTLGFGIESYMRGVVIDNNQKFKTELQKELKADGINAEVLVSADGTEFKINQK
jgi:hypothetical protein